MPTKRTPPPSRPRDRSSSTEGEKTGGEATPATPTPMGIQGRQTPPNTIPELPQTVVQRRRARDASVEPLRMSSREATAPEEAAAPHWTPSQRQFHDLLKILWDTAPHKTEGGGKLPRMGESSPEKSERPPGTARAGGHR
jgi:hypothetical protein